MSLAQSLLDCIGASILVQLNFMEKLKKEYPLRNITIGYPNVILLEPVLRIFNCGYDTTGTSSKDF